MDWSLRLVTPPDTEPLEAADLAAHVRLSAGEAAEQEALLTRKLKAAREACERATRRQLITATWELLLEHFPCEDGPVSEGCEILLTKAPLQSVTSIKYLDWGGVQQTLDPAAYVVEAPAGAGRAEIEPAFGTVWPPCRCQVGAVVVRFVAGYGDDGSKVPAELLDSILDYAAASYERREDGEAGFSRARAIWAGMRAA